MKLQYSCPFTGKQILEFSPPSPTPIYEAYCSECGMSHPLPICPRKIILEEES